ncbi:U-box domain-containing protein 4 [Apostasia shenzhenica]|uniref:U-box domain-containing protein 4 n=1 Tax=Apostasia shenzhenica TaxID=1088818 RepID=A0A2H9ZTD8_9ASPA|nr:U-box domain-containing protein 4 [Apostasia shenzhenica]
MQTRACREKHPSTVIIPLYFCLLLYFTTTNASFIAHSPINVDRRRRAAMAEDPEPVSEADRWLSHARLIIPTALDRARSASGFPGRWRSIASKLEQLPPCLSNLSSHPFFSKNSLCREQLHSVCTTLDEAIKLADRCAGASIGKLQMQSDLDSLSCKLDINLRDCNQLIKTGVIGEAAVPISELLARLQIGDAEAKQIAMEELMETIREDEKSVIPALNRSNISSLVKLLTTTVPRLRERAVAVICMLAESRICENLLVSEGVLPPLIRVVESGTPAGKEKAVMALERLSMPADTARLIAGHGGILPLIDLCRSKDSVAQLAAAAALKNLSAIPEVRQRLADEGVVKVMIDILDGGAVQGSKVYAAECLQNLTSGNESLRRVVVSEGGIRSLLAYIDSPRPQESAIGAVRNLAGSVSVGVLISMGILPRLIIALREGSLGAQAAAAATICRISSSPEVKKKMGELGFVPLLVKLTEARMSAAREAAAQALASLISSAQNVREVKRDEKSVPNLVQLLDPSPLNAAKKYAVACLLALSSSSRCKKQMCSHGAIGYLMKLAEMDVPGAKKLLERLEKGKKLRRLFNRK